MGNNITRVVPSAICAAIIAFPVRAADLISATAPPVEPAADHWTFSVTPYFWAAGLSGETRAFGLPGVVDFDTDFSDILDHLDFAAMAIVDARYDRYSISEISSIRSCRPAPRLRPER